MGASEVPTANRAGDPPTPSSRAVAAGADNERFANPYIGVGDDRRAQIVAALVEILPPGALLHRQAEVKPYECDGLTVFRQEPVAVALPNTEDEVVRVLKACHRLDVPVVARGAGTGLAGGAMPHGAGVVLSLARLNRIVAIDPLARTARVQPGVRNLAISEVAAPYDLYYAPDPSSQIACTIGGNVSENSGGVHCLKYGLTLNNVLAMRAITIDGEVLTVGSAALDTPGLDLMAVMIGSEGMLAVVTEVTVRLIPKPRSARVVMASFDDVERAGNAVAAIIGAGIIPAGMEMMDKKASRAVEPFVNAGYDLDAEAILLVEADGTEAEVAAEIAATRAVLEAAGCTGIAVSESEAERLRFWSGRTNAFPAAGRISADYYCMDGTIPKKNLGRMLVAISAMEERYGLRCMNVFHAGDGNLHPLILFDSNVAGEWQRADLFGAEILELCVELGGTVTGEHGVGIEKINSMCVQFSDDERQTFFDVKHAFDPKGLLNPGKAIPTLHRCAEYGKMHVRAGRLAFPELPRF
ncbi:MAG: FAD-linked oxidase C-terminal domain-containing protein [Burkholderiaceae bacterium]